MAKIFGPQTGFDYLMVHPFSCLPKLIEHRKFQTCIKQAMRALEEGKLLKYQDYIWQVKDHLKNCFSVRAYAVLQRSWRSRFRREGRSR